MTTLWDKANGDPRKSRGFRTRWAESHNGEWVHEGKRKGWRWVEREVQKPVTTTTKKSSKWSKG
jgi:hypothetical protein